MQKNKWTDKGASLVEVKSKLFGAKRWWLAILIVATSCKSEDSTTQSHWLSSEQITASHKETGKIRISWNDEALGHYLVYRKESNSEQISLAGWSQSSAFVDGNIAPGKTYSYHVFFSNKILESPELTQKAESVGTAFAISDDCFDINRVRLLKKQTDIPIFRQNIANYFSACAEVISKKIQFPLTGNELKAVVATFISHTLFSYGSSKAASLEDLLTEDGLDCDNYTFLTGHIYQILTGDDYTEDFIFTGFEGGAIGNHAQIIVASQESSILLDPTTGLVAKTNYTDLIAGVPIPDKQINSLYSYWGIEKEYPQMDNYFWRVKSALMNGLYRAEDHLYFIHRTKTP